MIEYSPRMQELLLKARERHQKNLANTLRRKLNAGYRFYILVQGCHGYKVYFRNRASAEQWLRSKYGYSERDQIHDLVQELSG